MTTREIYEELITYIYSIETITSEQADELIQIVDDILKPYGEKQALLLQLEKKLKKYKEI